MQTLKNGCKNFQEKVDFTRPTAPKLGQTDVVTREHLSMIVGHVTLGTFPKPSKSCSSAGQDGSGRAMVNSPTCQWVACMQLEAPCRPQTLNWPSCFKSLSLALPKVRAVVDLG